MRRRSGLLAVAILFGLAGCGNSSARGPEQVARDYFHDLGNQNYANACDLMSDDLRRRLGDCSGTLRRHQGGLTSADRAELRTVDVHHVPVKGDTAQVREADTRTSKTVTDSKGKTHTTSRRSIAVYHATDGKGLTLIKVGDTWRISGGGV